MYFNGHLDDKPYGQWSICKKCRKNKDIKLLNPNSVVYIKLAYNKSDDEAIQLIHSRNKTPFYKNNHCNSETYKKFQGHSDYDIDTICRWKKTQTDSYYKNKEEFINRYGIDAWNEKNKIKDSMSIEFFKNKYADLFESERLKRIKSTTQKRPAELTVEACKKWLARKSINILVIEDFYIKLDNLFNDKNIISIKYIIDDCFLEIERNTSNNKYKSIWLTYSIIVYDIKKVSLYERYGINSNVSNNCKLVNRIRNGNRSYNISEDGFYFRSGFEYTLYVKLKSINITILDINKKYPTSSYYYDFYVIINNEHIYIELCGDYSIGVYRDTQYIKKEMHNSILVGYKHINIFVRDLVNGKFNESNIYY